MGAQRHRTSVTEKTASGAPAGAPLAGLFPGLSAGLSSGLVGLVAGAVALVGLTACDSVAQLTGPDPADTAAELALALSSGSFDEVSFVDTESAAVAEEYAAITDGLGELTPTVTATDVETDGQTSALLSWSWPVGDRVWSYESTAELTEAGDTWQVGWAASVVEPSLAEGARLDASPIAAPARSHPRRRPSHHRHRPAGAPLRHRPHQVPARAAAVVRAPAGRAGGHRCRAVRPAGRGSRSEGVRRGDRLPRRRGPPGRSPGYERHPRRPAPPRRAAAGADPGVRGPPPRHGRRGHGRDDREGPRALPARRRGRAVRAAGALRRAAARHARRRWWTRSTSDGNERELFRVDAAPRRAAAAHPRPSISSPRPRAAARPGRRRPARWWRSGPRPAPSSRRRTAPATTATTWPPSASSPRDRRSRRSAPWPCCVPG